jgi:hypothetical protein
MIWKFCLANKENPISENVYGCTTVVPFGNLHIGEFYRSVNDLDFPDLDSSLFPIPSNWVFEFSGDEFTIRLKVENESLEALKTDKRKEIDFEFSECTRKGSETCYVVTSVTSKLTSEKIVMDNAEIDLTNMRSLLELMERYDQDFTVIRDYHNIEHPGVSFSEVDDIKFDMMLRGAGLHQKKGVIRSQIDNAKTIEELNAINWEESPRKK